MICKAMIIDENKFSVLLILMLCLSNLILLGAEAENKGLVDQQHQIKIEEGEIPIFGGIQSIRATIGDSRIGVLYGTTKNPQPLYLFTEFSQKIATVQIFNRRGTLEKETELKIHNIFVLRLDAIIEFSDRDNNGLYNTVKDRTPLKMINISTISFHVSKSNDGTSSSGDYLRYSVNFTANNVSYQRSVGPTITSTLENLCFSFELTIEQDQVVISEVPIISIYPQNLGFEASTSVEKESLTANRLTPRLKFSSNITGWDFSTPKSKILLVTTVITHEEILTSLGSISGKKITREDLKSIDIFSRMIFNVEQDGKPKISYLNHNDNRTNEYSAHKFAAYRISVGNAIRNFLNLTWLPNLNVDGKDSPAIFQLLKSGEANFPLHHLNPIAGLFLIGGFVFPQGEEIYYDPEVELEELNPILQLAKIPNRSILEESSLMILISGFFIGTLILFRQISLKRR
ncbi:MAG: hypothetical protein ACFE9L_11870 [Candidatus Hodarchaeota archaeon]